ncbi:MAG: hypothetical protein M3P49_01955 [Actinomycetota bacterium]|nr:hypothetical protein [Actinomycetota bacterium]
MPQNVRIEASTQGEAEVRHRSAGRGRQGLKPDEKISADAVARELRGVLSDPERQELSHRLVEKSEELMLHPYSNEYLRRWAKKRRDLMTLVAKELRSL